MPDFCCIQPVGTRDSGLGTSCNLTPEAASELEVLPPANSIGVRPLPHVIPHPHRETDPRETLSCVLHQNLRAVHPEDRDRDSLREEEECLMPFPYRHLRVAALSRFFTPTPTLRTRCLHCLSTSVAHRPFPTSHAVWRAQNRGKKTKASVTLDDLPQGVIPLEPLPLEDDAPAYPTVVRQARSNMQKFENCVLLTRVGGFYELYFEHADDFAPLLNLKPAKKFTNAGYVSMVIRPSLLHRLCSHLK